MKKLFEIVTADVEVSWHAPLTQSRVLPQAMSSLPGHLSIKPRRHSTKFEKIWRDEVPEDVAFNAELVTGPKLFEQTDYKILVRSKSGKSVELMHSDPNISKSLIPEDAKRLIYGSVNFGSEVGFSQFTIVIDGKPEFDFTIEVFPSKLDYKSDYEQLVAETQDYISGLIFEYIRSTFRLSLPVLPKQSSLTEWLLLLKNIIDDLESSTLFISRNPIRGRTRDRIAQRTQKITRLDSFVRKAINSGAGSGGHSKCGELLIRDRLPTLKSSFSLDTPEHRWISNQLRRIRDRLVTLRSAELQRQNTNRSYGVSPRRQMLIDDLNSLEQRILSLQQLEPFQEVTDLPPTGFASLQLLSAAGYRECYKACNLLSLGLQIEGGPVNLSLKEISALYEYWCFLTVIDLISECTGKAVPVDQLVKTRHSGLEISLELGRESSVPFILDDGRKITVSYNKTFDGASMLVSQRPDIVITIEDINWPKMTLLLDAKYRVRFDDDYIKAYKAPGPDIDAVNSLHRYRDAILESTASRPKRTVIQAAAIFPYRDSSEESFRESKLWKSIGSLGIGAIPLLPGNKAYLKQWLLSVINSGSWSMADLAISHSANDKSVDWRIAASEPVLIGVLKPEIAKEHLEWIATNRCYYMPLLKSHPRQLATKWVGVYSPAQLRNPGAVTHKAKVLDVSVLPRDQIETPWSSSRSTDDLFAVFKLGELVELSHPVVNQPNSGRAQRFSQPRWGTRLSLERAQVLQELFLETEPEWRLYEALRAANIRFRIQSTAPKTLKADGGNWRTWFILDNDRKIRYAGLQGFLILLGGMERFVPKIETILEIIAKEAPELQAARDDRLV